MTATYVVGMFTLAGSALGFLGALVIAHLAARAEAKRQTRDLGIKIALAHLEHRMKEGQALAEATESEIEVKPISIFVVEGIKMAEIISNPRLSGDEIGQALAKLTSFTNAVQRGINDKK